VNGDKLFELHCYKKEGHVFMNSDDGYYSSLDYSPMILDYSASIVHSHSIALTPSK
jgi:hypothetical protein